jgi:hypothetical protein
MAMSKTVTDVRDDVSARLSDLRPAVEEHELLSNALAALDAIAGASGANWQRRNTRSRTRRGPARDRPAAATKPQPAASTQAAAVGGIDAVTGSPRRSAGGRSARSRPRKRAPRGANRTAVLSVVEARPGATSGEIAEAAGVDRKVLYGLLRALVARGELRKEELPAGMTGYAVAPTPSVAADAPE